jgi:hypothetical protein
MSNIITTQQAKDYMGITVSTYDTLIGSFVEMVTQEIETYTDREFTQSSYNEILSIQNSRFDLEDDLPLNTQSDRLYLRLRQTPVVTFSSITQNSVTVSNENYTVDSVTGVITFYEPVSDYKDQLVANYTAGYADPTVTGSAYSMPRDLQMVALQGVKVMFENSGTAKQGQGNVKSKSLKDFSVSYGNEQSGLYVNINGQLMKSYLVGNKIILDKYKYISL